MPDKTIKAHINQQFICPECGWVMLVSTTKHELNLAEDRTHSCKNCDCINYNLIYEAPKTELTLYEK